MTKRDFLFELGCEELPPKALPKLAASLLDNVIESFSSLGLTFESNEWQATPRRLAIRFLALDTAQADRKVEKLGPAIAAAYDNDGNARPAAVGFARSNGVSIEELSRKQTDKGERLAFVAEVKGRQTSELLQDILQKAISQLPVPKAMRWGNSNHQFSRPVHWLLALLGEEVVPLKLFGLSASNRTFGHRFHAPQAISLDNPGEYDAKLLQAKVVSCFQARKAQIRQQIDAISGELGAQAVVDEDLLDEVAALVEWPVALVGNFDQAFLSVPAEALVSSMAEHQKYFHLVDANNRLLPKFITIANIDSRHPASVVEGNEKVIRPRLADAKFFYDSDCKVPLSSHNEKLKSVTFQNKLGSLYDKTLRISSLSKVIARLVGANETLTERAAEICKCDLMTNMVGEFPDLQGVMGRYYAINDDEPEEVALAMDEVYMPRYAGDKLPDSRTGLVLAIAERIDTLVGIFGIGQIPTGAKDPFALRRAALGVLRLICEKELNLDLTQLIDASLKTFVDVSLDPETRNKLLQFFNARQLALYQSKGLPTQVVGAVQAVNITNPLDFEKRVFAVERFNQSDESAALAEANKRVGNILAKSSFDGDEITIDESLFEGEEADLYSTINQVSGLVQDLVAQGNYQSALDELASLKTVVNNFFDKVMINADDPAIRNNRLKLISKLRELFLGIADISLLQK